MERCSRSAWANWEVLRIEEFRMTFKRPAGGSAGKGTRCHGSSAPGTHVVAGESLLCHGSSVPGTHVVAGESLLLQIVL